MNNGEYLEFVEVGGYEQFQYWFSESLEWVNKSERKAPMYWHKIDEKWYYYTLNGLKSLNLDEPVVHISMFEADAFAKWKNKRLPTEFEWEIACNKFSPKINTNANFVEKELFSPVFKIIITSTMVIYGNGHHQSTGHHFSKHI